MCLVSPSSDVSNFLIKTSFALHFRIPFVIHWMHHLSALHCTRNLHVNICAINLSGRKLQRRGSAAPRSTYLMSVTWQCVRTWLMSVTWKRVRTYVKCQKIFTQIKFWCDGRTDIFQWEQFWDAPLNIKIRWSIDGRVLYVKIPWI